MGKVISLWLFCSLLITIAAAEFHLTDADELQDVLETVGNNGDDDTIYLAAGTYQGNFAYSPVDGKSLIIRGESGTIPQEVILDGRGTGRVLSIQGRITGSVRIEGVTIQNGNASTMGGGIYLRPWEDGVVDMEIWNCVIRNNQAGKRGGGIKAHTYGGNSRINLLIVNSLIYKNRASWTGGGIDVSSSEVGDSNVTRAVVINSTITENIADGEGGGGIRAFAYRGNGAITFLELYNTILYGNKLGDGTPQDLRVGEREPGDAMVDAFHNDIGDVDVKSGTYNPVNVISADPAFVDPPNDDYHLTPSSPCIDKGTTTVPDPPGLPTIDFEGNPRIYGSAPDIGAYEWQEGGIEEKPILQPAVHSLLIHPNPFSHRTVISVIGDGSLRIYSSDGRVVRNWNLKSSAGNFSTLIWDGTSDNRKPLPSGIYFCRLETSGHQVIKKLILSR